jgi:hypothetical protein
LLAKDLKPPVYKEWDPEDGPAHAPARWADAAVRDVAVAARGGRGSARGAAVAGGVIPHGGGQWGTQFSRPFAET